MPCAPSGVVGLLGLLGCPSDSAFSPTRAGAPPRDPAACTGLVQPQPAATSGYLRVLAGCPTIPHTALGFRDTGTARHGTRRRQATPRLANGTHVP